MKEIRYVITNKNGLHARPAGEFVKTAQAFACQVTAVKGNKETDAKRLLGIMGLSVKCGEELVLRFEGTGEEAAASLMEQYLYTHL